MYMYITCNVLYEFRADVEMVEYALETILNLVESGSGDPSDLGLQFSEIFLKKPENVVLVLNCLEVCVCVCVCVFMHACV